MGQTDLERGRRAYDERAWDVCCAALSAADEAATLPPEDLKRLAIAQYLSGDEQASLRTVTRGHKACVDLGRWPDAAETAFWNGP